ncbi:MAG: hypothetical protein EXS00_06700 [Phycisphaerales bacterium]|nr:hypothetical protein [Phycisphaerales bacterium]
MNNDNSETQDERFGTDMDLESAAANPSRASDSLSVHGLLSLLGQDESKLIYERVRRAMTVIRAEIACSETPQRSGVLARIHWRRGAAVLAAAAMLALSLIVMPMLGDNKAYAALRSVVDAQKSMVGRSYEIVIERGVDASSTRSTRATLEIGSGGRFVVNLTEGCMRDAMAALSLGGSGRSPQSRPRLDDRLGKGKDPVAPDGGMLGKRPDHRPEGRRQGEAPRDPEAMARMRERSCNPDRCALPGAGSAVFGCDGKTRWFIAPSGKVMRPEHLGAESAPREGTDSGLDILTLDSTLARLEHGYQAEFVDADSEPRADGRPVVRVEALLRPGNRSGSGRMPSKVELCADAATFEILRMEATWDPASSPLQMRKIVFDLLGTNERSDDFFDGASHESESSTDSES